MVNKPIRSESSSSELQKTDMESWCSNSLIRGTATGHLQGQEEELQAHLSPWRTKHGKETGESRKHYRAPQRKT